MSEVLEISKLSKKFGKLQAVNELDLTINKGQIYGLLGPNGSGKTTTLGMILDVVTPDSGSYRWFGQKPTAKLRTKIGSILETPCFYPYLNAFDNLKISAHIKGVSFSSIDAVLDRVGLLGRKNDKFKTYSLGMKQRLSIASALLADPPVLILDEPTNGLDPQGIAEIRNLIKDISHQGKSIILASHLLDEVQKICTNFCVMRNGKKLFEGEVASILNDTAQYELSSMDHEALQEILASNNRVLKIQDEGDFLLITADETIDAAKLNEYCHQNGVLLTRLYNRKNSLENEFLKILESND
ncbi:MAG: ABC transporter ATP-binding protein [Cyclobacteriaceae bacterium]